METDDTTVSCINLYEDVQMHCFQGPDRCGWPLSGARHRICLPCARFSYVL